MGRFFGWKLRKHINIPNFYRGQYHQTIFHDTYFSDCTFSFIFWQKSSILRISSKKFLSSKVFEDFSKFRRIFIFVFGLFSEPEDSSSSSSVHFWSSLQHWSIAQNAYCLSKLCLLIIMPIDHKAYELFNLL